MMNKLLAPWRAIRQRYWAALLFDVCLILLVFWAIHAWQTRDLPGPGDLPGLEAVQLDGDRVPQGLPSEGKGVVYFFAPWCFYCKHSIDNLDALVQNGDVVCVDVERRLIQLEVDEAELARRREAWSPPPPRYERGYGYMFSRHIQQAPQGCDFDYLTSAFGAPVSEPAIY